MYEHDVSGEYFGDSFTADEFDPFICDSDFISYVEDFYRPVCADFGRCYLVNWKATRNFRSSKQILLSGSVDPTKLPPKARTVCQKKSDLKCELYDEINAEKAYVSKINSLKTQNCKVLPSIVGETISLGRENSTEENAFHSSENSSFENVLTDMKNDSYEIKKKMIFGLGNDDVVEGDDTEEINVDNGGEASSRLNMKVSNPKIQGLKKRLQKKGKKAKAQFLKKMTPIQEDECITIMPNHILLQGGNEDNHNKLETLTDFDKMSEFDVKCEGMSEIDLSDCMSVTSFLHIDEEDVESMMSGEVPRADELEVMTQQSLNNESPSFVKEFESISPNGNNISENLDTASETSFLELHDGYQTVGEDEETTEPK